MLCMYSIGSGQVQNARGVPRMHLSRKAAPCATSPICCFLLHVIGRTAILRQKDMCIYAKYIYIYIYLYICPCSRNKNLSARIYTSDLVTIQLIKQVQLFFKTLAFCGLRGPFLVYLIS